MSNNVSESGGEGNVDAEGSFKLVSNGMKLILGDEGGSCDNDCIHNTIGLIQSCVECVEREYLMSKNEQIEDIGTSTLKYLFLGYYLAKCYQSLQGMDTRLDNLLSCRDSYNSFLQMCSRLHLYHEADQEIASYKTGAVSADQKRTNKIEKFKRDRAAKARINELQRLLYITRKDGADGAVDHEDEQRELYITQLQCYIRDAMDDLDMLQQEMTMLRYHQTQQRETDVNGGSADARMNGRVKGDGDGASRGMFLDNYAAGAGPQHNGPGISVTRTYKVGDQIMFSRDTVKATVFGSHIAPPTMSLEEFGDLQKAEAIERAEREQAGRDDGSSAAMNARRMKQLEQDGDEDDADLADQAAMKDRAWDDWKDNNPRGWGNKAGKRF